MSDIDHETMVNYVFERLDDLKEDLNDIITAVEGAPHQPPRDLDWLPPGALSHLEAIGTAIFAAEQRWGR